MISHRYRCIFIHIPKCAGTSVESALGHLDGHVGRGGQDHRPLRRLAQPWLTRRLFASRENLGEAARRLKPRRRTVLNPRNRLTVTRAQYDAYYKFAFVRNPWSRAFSWYHNVLRDDVHRRHLGVPPDIGLPDFLQRCAGRGHLRPQLYWLHDFHGALPFDFIGRFESLARDFEHVSRDLGLKQTTLPHREAGSREDYRPHYDARSKALISRIYAEEIALFGYTFDA